MAVPVINPGKYNIIIPPNIISLIKLRNTFRKRWQRHRLSNILKNSYHFLRNLIDIKLSESRNNSWSKNLESMTNCNDKLCTFVRIIKNKQNSIPILKKDNQNLITATEKCDVLKKVFESAHTLTANYKSTFDRHVKEKKIGVSGIKSIR